MSATSKRDRVVSEQLYYEAPGKSYPEDQVLGATGRRDGELALLLRMAVQVVARHLMVAVAPSRRSTAETYFLRDCIRDRRKASSETLSQLLDIQSRAEAPHYLSEQFRMIEAQLLPSKPVCIHEVSEAEQESNAALDMAQLLFAKERSPVRAVQVAETGTQQLYRTRALVDQAWRVARTGRIS